MSNMSLLRIADLNLIYKIKEILEDKSITSYRVIDGYPNEIDLRETTFWPTVAVEIDMTFGRDVELGSEQWTGLAFSIDIFALTDSQRDDLGYILWKELNENSYTLYDFNDAFPPAVGNYTGCTRVGDWALGKLTINTIESPTAGVSEGEKHHSLIDGIIYLPNITI